ncbi:MULTISPECIES: Cthe_2314 family HEPN domain-containing protein [Bacillus cereus group]|uniref:Cthe_2314 family HEPN domain-containing protein n=1 Tax=Bacillus cereus group TaxID=86661 RepID=UPI00254A4034|nr:Cthe_2314 family HEPN domain-containing protein [Bacillus paranthracis]MDK7489683.1 Cthe_2314 family HEPN domain-containing protein [Bacillus paranthracis]
MNKDEKKYLTGILNAVNDYEKYTANFYVFGNVNENDSIKEISYYGDLDSWLTNINYLNRQIKYTAEVAFEILEEKEEVEFDVWGMSHREAYYHTENMMFRISILWDLLAHMFNRVFSLNENIDEIHHYTFFQKYQSKARKSFHYRKLAKEIYDYFEEENSIQEGFWKGNFKYCKRLRNDFTHSLNPHIMNVNNGNFKNKNKRGMNMAEHPLFELKRLLEDFTKVNEFISTLINEYISDEKFYITR